MTTDAHSESRRLDQRFPGEQRLRTSTDIARVFAKKHASGDDAMVVYLSDNGLAWSRLCVIASRRVGNAVRRNAIRRRLREVFRRNQDALPKGFDIICVVRPRAGEVYGDLEESFRSLVARAVRKTHRRQGR